MVLGNGLSHSINATNSNQDISSNSNIAFVTIVIAIATPSHYFILVPSSSRSHKYDSLGVLSAFKSLVNVEDI